MLNQHKRVFVCTINTLYCPALWYLSIVLSLLHLNHFSLVHGISVHRACFLCIKSSAVPVMIWSFIMEGKNVMIFRQSHRSHPYQATKQQSQQALTTEDNLKKVRFGFGKWFTWTSSWIKISSCDVISWSQQKHQRSLKTLTRTFTPLTGLN